MFYATKQNKYIVEGTAFELDGVQYPAVWLNQSTAEQKAAIGLEEVVATNSPADATYYWVSETLDKATLTYVNTPKDLDGLKKSSVDQVKATTYSLLQPTDYIDTRNLRDPEYKPDWMAWRSAVLDKSREAVAAVKAASDIDSLIIACKIEWPHDPNYVQPTQEKTEVVA